MQLINWPLIRNPYNWVVVFFLCVFAAFGLSLIFPPSSDEG